MKITAVTYDQVIVVDGVPAFMAEIGGFEMTNGEWAVHFNDAIGIGEIEYTDARSNATLSPEGFQASYAWLITEHQRYLDHVEQQNVANGGSGDTGGGDDV
ncbi:hypothetical protein [Photobacterium arenosum]|uniref:hypothetical protein n=1 Tax=Photobacterium arenosum TaxID=2774143 RepID=UPI00288C04B0|nr:hypothetical protein [Photobacterium arenosum]